MAIVLDRGLTRDVVSQLGCEVPCPAAPLPPEELARRLRQADRVPPSPVAG